MAIENNSIVGVRRQYGNTQGQYDNYSWSGLDLFGTPDAPGLLYQMRYKAVQIKKSMDDRRNFLASIKVEFAGKHAKQLNNWWKTFQVANQSKGFRFTLSSFMASQLDQISTYGFSLQEKRWEMDPDLGPLLYVWQIDPVTIFEFDQPDGRLTKPAQIRFWNTKAATQLYLSADQFYLESNPIFPGNFWGLSDLYPLIQDYLALDAEYKLYLEARMIEKGIIVAQENSEGTTEASYRNMTTALQGVLRGQSPAIIMDKGWAPLSVLQYNNGTDAVTQFNTARDKFDERIKLYFDSTLATLGLSTSGSRALGETFKIADQQKFEAFLENYFEDFLASELMLDICKVLEIPAEEVELATPGIQSSSDKFDPAAVLTFMKDTGVTFESLGEENQRILFGSLGLDFDVYKAANKPAPAPEDGTITPTTLSEDLPFILPPAASQVAAEALLERSKRPSAEKGLSMRELDLAKRIASGDELSKLDINQLKGWFSKNDPDEYPDNHIMAYEYDCLGGEDMKAALFPGPSEESESVMKTLEDIDLVPTEQMQREAQKGLDLRRQFGRGGTAVGVARARDIANAKSLSPETISRMVSFFSRHEKSVKEGKGFKHGSEGYPSAGKIAWLLWGGEGGFDWAKRKQDEIRRVRGERV
jgi:hypothetical protein